VTMYFSDSMSNIVEHSCKWIAGEKAGAIERTKKNNNNRVLCQ